MKKNRKIIYMVIIIGLIGVLGGLVVEHNMISGDWNFITLHLINIFMWLIFIGSGFIFIFNRKRTTMLSSVGICTLEGFFFSGLAKYLYDNNIWLDTVIQAPNTIEEYMIMLIIVWVIIGLIVGAFRK